MSQQTANVLSIQHILVRNTGSRVSAAQSKELRPHEAAFLLPNEDQALAVSSVLRVMHCLADQMQTVEQRVRNHIKSTPLYT